MDLIHSVETDFCNLVKKHYKLYHININHDLMYSNLIN